MSMVRKNTDSNDYWCRANSMRQLKNNKINA